MAAARYLAGKLPVLNRLLLPPPRTENPPNILPVAAPAASASSLPSASASSIPAKTEINQVIPSLFGALNARVWRPKTREDNPNYPRVTSPGCYFIEHSGGFQLMNRSPLRYLGHYTKAATRELERKYGKKKRSRKSK